MFCGPWLLVSLNISNQRSYLWPTLILDYCFKTSFLVVFLPFWFWNSLWLQIENFIVIMSTELWKANKRSVQSKKISILICIVHILYGLLVLSSSTSLLNKEIIFSTWIVGGLDIFDFQSMWPKWSFEVLSSLCVHPCMVVVPKLLH